MKKNEVTTNVTKKDEPHNNFKAIIQFDDTPTELRIQADKTELDVKDLTRNPNKYSFGKLISRNQNSIEFYMYPHDSMNHINLSFKKDFFAKTDVFTLDIRRIREFFNLMMRIRYFLSLNKDKRLIFLRKRGFSANINITRRTMKND